MMENESRIAALERALDEEVSQRIRAIHNLEHRLKMLELNREVALAQLVESRFKASVGGSA
jgi:HPt (histidine-containing phosphotransfer) domain-containing protein